jgi:hypothetical protein
MGCASKKVAFCMAICLLSLILIAGCFSSDPDPRMLSSGYSYSLRMHTTEPITNVTFYLPLPVKNGVPMVGQVVLHESDFAWNNLSFEIVASPPGLNLTGAYPAIDNEPRYLKISTDRVYLNETQDGSYLIEIDNLTWLESPLSFADTVDPYFNETVFLPKLNFALPASNERMNETSPYPVPYDYQLTAIAVSQQIPIYAEYSASPTTRVTISSTISGANVWMEGYDAWRSNSYADYYDWCHYGDSHGWQTASGKYKAARGVYPNLSHPVWQEVLNGTAEE